MSQEVSCKLVRTVLDYARHQGGQDAVDKLVAVAGVPYEQLHDENAWVDHEVEKRIFRALDRVIGIDRAAKLCGEHGMRAGSLGALEVLVRALWRPRNVYSRVPYLANRLAKVGKMKLVEIGEKTARVQYRYAPAFESIREICDHRHGMLAAVPVLWGLPPAVVEEAQCSAAGGEVCDYRIAWQEPLEDRMRLRCTLASAAAGGGILAAVAEGAVPLGWIAGGAAAVLCVVGGWLIGDAWDQAREMRAVRSLVAAQNEKLAQQLLLLEQKFREIERLNSVLEGQVGQRTRELERELDRLRRLGELSRALAATLDADAIVRLATGSLPDLLDAGGWLLGPAPSSFDEGAERASPVPPRSSLPAEEQQQARAVIAEMREKGELQRAGRIGEREGVTVVLSSSGESLGALCVVRDRDHGPYGPRDVEACRLLGDIFVAALVNARLLERASRL